MDNIKLNDITYGFIKNYKHQKHLRGSFNELTEVTFGFNFEDWYQNGFWGENYMPYSLIFNNKVISNVSVSKIEFIVENKQQIGIQIGTVMTDKEYRHQGLSKYIMEEVLNEWEKKADFIYLFANDSVLDFYPKFNFEIIDEYQFSKTLNISKSSKAFRKLNVEIKADKVLLIEAINNSLPISELSMRNNASLIMFYCLTFLKNNIYFLEKLNAVVIANMQDDILFLNDVFSREQVELDEIIQLISDESIKRVVFGFTPLNEMNLERNILKQEDTTLFVIKDKADYFKKKYWMFPVLSHA